MKRKFLIIASFAVIVLGLLKEGLENLSYWPRETLDGHAQIIDGDSLVINGTRIRLVGIDAPEGPQTCRTSDGRPWACGRDATRHLSRLIERQKVNCAAERRDQHKRVLAICRVGNLDLNRRMVQDGYAVAFGKRFRAVERDAKRRKAGLWRGSFERPQDWRRRNQR